MPATRPEPSRGAPPRWPDGLLLVDKPVGPSSHDVVLTARRALGIRRAGHGGTLDPFASGLVVVLYGRATRLLPWLAGEPKVYEATIRFGAETDTEDHLGTVTATAPAPTRAAVEAAIPALTGTIAQVPPAFSAKHVDGKRAYELARAGVAVHLPPVSVRVDGWELLAWREAPDAPGASPAVEADVRITCGGGTYIRSLARDLGRAVGSAAHLTRLRRTASGPFRVADAVAMPALRDLAPADVPARPALDALGHLPIEPLDAEHVAKVVRGISVPATVAGPRAALLDARTGVLVAAAERRGDEWQPRIVMQAA